MNSQWLSIRGLDPLLLRDGRPFSTEEGGNAARTLGLPLPSTLAGFVRTREGNARGVAWTRADGGRALQLSVHGPLLCRDARVLAPAPRDALIYTGAEANAVQMLPLRPQPLAAHRGCDLPDGLQPLRIPRAVKPASGYHFWPLDEVQKWLARTGNDVTAAPAPCAGLEREVRFYNKISPSTRTVDRESGALFSVELVSFQSRDEAKNLHHWSLLARIPGDLPMESAGCLGGEKRLALVDAAPDTTSLDVSGALRAAFTGATRVRMQLATPAVFVGGWRPGWIDAQSLEGECGGVRLKLVGAATGRREAVSGWDFQTNRAKAVKWLAPAGSVYFFQVLAGEASALLDTWLAPVSDEAQDRRDGFGLAFWGVW